MKPFVKENYFYLLSKELYVRNYSFKQGISYFGIVPQIV